MGKTLKAKPKIIKKQTLKVNKIRRKKDEIKIPKSKYNFSYVVSHSGIVTTLYPYEIIVPQNIRLIQYTPKGNTLTGVDVLYLFNKFKKNPNKKGIIKNPQYFSLNKDKQIFKSDLELNVTEPGGKTNNLFLYDDQHINYNAYFKKLTNNPDKFPIIDIILKENEKVDINSYFHMGLYDYINNKKFDLDKLGNFLGDLHYNNQENKQKKRFTLQEILLDLSNYYYKMYPKNPKKVVNFVQLGCNIEENRKKARKYTITREEYIEIQKNKEFGFFNLNDTAEINKHIEKNINKNILTMQNIDDNIDNGYIMSSNKSDIEKYLKNMMDIS
jgi:hypothetical protein